MVDALNIGDFDPVVLFAQGERHELEFPASLPDGTATHDRGRSHAKASLYLLGLASLFSLEASKEPVGDAIWSGLAVFPTIYGGERDPNEMGKVFLGQLQSLAQATDALRIHTLLFQSLASLWADGEPFPMPECKPRAHAPSMAGSCAPEAASRHRTAQFAAMVGVAPGADTDRPKSRF